MIGDGLVKAEFSTRDGVESGAQDLKRRFSVLQVKIYELNLRQNARSARPDAAATRYQRRRSNGVGNRLTHSNWRCCRVGRSTAHPPPILVQKSAR